MCEWIRGVIFNFKDRYFPRKPDQPVLELPGLISEGMRSKFGITIEISGGGYARIIARDGSPGIITTVDLRRVKTSECVSGMNVDGSPKNLDRLEDQPCYEVGDLKQPKRLLRVGPPIFRLAPA